MCIGRRRIDAQGIVVFGVLDHVAFEAEIPLEMENEVEEGVSGLREKKGFCEALSMLGEFGFVGGIG